MIERRKEPRVRKNFVLTESIVELMGKISEEHGISEAAVVSTAVKQLADKYGIALSGKLVE